MIERSQVSRAMSRYNSVLMNPATSMFRPGWSWRSSSIAIYTIYYSLLSMICPKCSHEWTYKGKSSLYVTCPNCYRKIHAEPSGSTKQPITVQSFRVSDAEMESILADREAHIQKLANKWGPEWQESFWCCTCGAEFHVGYNTARYCPMCRSDKVVTPPQEPNAFGGFRDTSSPQSKRCHELLEARRNAEAVAGLGFRI